MPVGHEDHAGVPVAVAVALRLVDQPLDLGLGQMLAGAQVGVGTPRWGNCSFYGGWRDQAGSAMTTVRKSLRLVLAMRFGFF